MNEYQGTKPGGVTAGTVTNLPRASDQAAEIIAKLDRVSRWIDKFTVPTAGATAMICHLRDVKESIQDRTAVAHSAAQAPEGARAFLMSQDLYSLLMDIQNGIDSPATCGLANKLIIRLDKVRDSLATPAAPTCTPADERVPECGMCNDSGIVGFPPDQYEECPDCIKACAAQGAGIAPIGADDQRDEHESALEYLRGMVREREDQVSALMLERDDLLEKLRNPAPVSTAAAPAAPATEQQVSERDPWYCAHCKNGVPAQDVTFEEAHDPRAGGCGYRVGEWPLRAPAATTASASVSACSYCNGKGQLRVPHLPGGWAKCGECSGSGRAPSRAADGQQGASRAALEDVKGRFANILERNPTEPTRKDALAGIAIIDAAIARAPLLAQDGWQPIATAPADCILLLAYEFDRPGDWRIKVGGYWNGEWEVFGASWTPTRWMPLPAAPTGSDYAERRDA